MSATGVSINQLREREIIASEEHATQLQRSLKWAERYRAAVTADLRETETELARLKELQKDAA